MDEAQEGVTAQGGSKWDVDMVSGMEICRLWPMTATSYSAKVAISAILLGCQSHIKQSDMHCTEPSSRHTNRRHGMNPCTFVYFGSPPATRTLAKPLGPIAVMKTSPKLAAIVVIHHKKQRKEKKVRWTWSKCRTRQRFPTG